MPQATAIEEAASNLVGVNNLLGQAKKDSTVIARQWDLTNKLLSGMATYAGGWLFMQTKIGREIHDATHKLKEIAAFPFQKNLEASQRDMAWLREEAASFYKEQANAGKLDSVMTKERLAQFKAQFGYMNDILVQEKARNVAVQKYDEFHQRINWQLGAYVILLQKAASLWYTVNQVLSESRTAEGGRAKYFNESLRAAIQLGASANETMMVMSALVERGRDLTGTLGKDVSLALQLHKAYGLSTYDAAELISSFGRLNVDTVKVANGIARVTAETALSANEAARLASSMARTFALMRPGQVGGLGEVSEYLLGLEGQMKSLTGTAGDLTAFYTRAATTLEGMGLAEQLGIDPSTLGKNKAAAEKFTVGLANMVDNMTRGLDDRSRVLVLQQLAQRLGTDATMLANLTEALKANNKQASEELTLRKQFEEQMRETGQSVRRLYNSFSLLIGQVMVPLVRILTPVVDWFTKFINALITFKPVLVVLQGLALVAFPYFLAKAIQAGVAMFVLGKALINFAKTAAQAAIATQAQAIANRQSAARQGGLWLDMWGPGRRPSRIPRVSRPWGGRFGRLARLGVQARRLGTVRGTTGVLQALSGIKDAILGSRSIWMIIAGGGRAMLAFIKPVMTGLVIALKGILAAVGVAGGVLLAVGAGLSVALYYGFKSLHKAQDQEIKAMLQANKVQDDLKATIRKQITAEAVKGNVAGMYDVAARARSSVKSGSPEIRRAIEEAIGLSFQNVEAAVNQRFLRDVREQHGVAKSEEDLQYYDRMLEASEQLRLTAVEQLKEMQRQAKSEEEKKAAAEKAAERERLLKFEKSGVGSPRKDMMMF